MPNSQNAVGFASWSQKFFAYLDHESTNAHLRSFPAKLGYGGTRELALSIFNYLRERLWHEFRSERRRAGIKADKNISRAIQHLTKAANAYEKLERVAPEIRSGRILGATASEGFVDGLNAERDRLAEQRGRARVTFSLKRAGNRSDLSILVRLQDFVDEMCSRSGKPLADGKTRHLSATDLADLIEAGKSALGMPDNDIFTEVGAIERALQRFRKHPDNLTICASLKQDAITACDKLGLGTPISVSH